MLNLDYNTKLVTVKVTYKLHYYKKSVAHLEGVPHLISITSGQ